MIKLLDKNSKSQDSQIRNLKNLDLEKGIYKKNYNGASTKSKEY